MDTNGSESQGKRLPEDTSQGEEVSLAHRDRAGVPASRRSIVRADNAMLAQADKIIIDGLEVFAHHGVYAAEAELGQKFVVSATLYTHLHVAGISDELDDSIDYGEVCRFIDKFLRANTFNLIEAAAEALAGELLYSYPELVGVRVKIEKPWAPIGLPLKGVAVEIERSR